MKNYDVKNIPKDYLFQKKLEARITYRFKGYQ